MPQESLPFTVSLDLALGGKGAVNSKHYEQALAGADKALDWLRNSKDDGSIELFSIPSRTDDIAKAKEAAAKLLENTTDIAILGIGGSSLGGKALQALRPAGATPRIEFFDNPDPVSWAEALARFDLKT